ncbi:helix-turn-helix transcriptional regulator [Salinicola endophyticus]|uniref:helix-turn-helix transcriptional regulator n=1 Tax=Salinicola endophyticus TaxID=1949083 RepID=UPI000DA11E18|nr:helix-turn-helix transcriptional regulator [Salinicola endophyticus]
MDEGKKIREIRELFDLSRPQFADKTGISVHTIHSTELGRMKCSIETLRAVQKAYPQFAKWLNEIPLEDGDGQSTPEIERTRDRLKPTGTDTESQGK